MDTCRVVSGAKTGLTVAIGHVLAHVPLAEVPDELQPHARQLVGQQIPILPSGASYSYRHALGRIPPVSPDRVTPAIVRAITGRQLYVETGNAIITLPRREATRSQVLRLDQIYRHGQSVSILGGSIVAAQPGPYLLLPVARGDTVSGTVTSTFLTADGRPAVKIEILPGIIGIADTTPFCTLARYDRVTACVVNVNHSRQRIRLRLLEVI